MRELFVHSQLDDLSVATIGRAAQLPPDAMQIQAQKLQHHGATLTRSELGPYVAQQVPQRHHAPSFAYEDYGQVSLPQRSFSTGNH
eukprot:5896085-Pyramimonas_sp.AAC.1